MTAATWDPGAPAALRHERQLFLAAQPVAWMLSRYARRRGPDVCRVPGLGYVVSGAETCRAVLLDGATYTKTGGASAGVLITQVMGEHALLNMDGEPHIALRRRLQDLFTPRSVNDLTSEVLGAQITSLHDRLAAGETIDIARFARILTGTMLCHMNGMTLAGRELEQRALELYDIGARMAKLVPLRVRRLPEARVREGRALFAQLVAGTRDAYERGPATSIPGRLREIGLTYEEARGVIGMLMIAGTETTTTAISRIVALLADTGQWSRLRADPDLRDGAIDEGLRVVTPVPVFTRTIARDHELCGVQLRRDRLLLAFLTSACRDPRVIERGDEFDIGRETPRALRHLWFGAGPHFCVGFNLARREIALVLDAICQLDREIEVVERRAARGVLLPTYERLVVRQRSLAGAA